MKIVSASLASLAASLVPAIAAACPGSHGAAESACCGGSSLTGYLLAVGAGLLVGVGSVAVERKLRRK